MALAGLPEDLVLKIHESRPKRSARHKQKHGQQADPSHSGDGGPRHVQSAEALVKARVATCDLLFRALRIMANTLATAGRELQRTTTAAQKSGPLKQALQSGSPDYARLGLGMLEACNSLGGALACLSTTFSEELLESLQETKRNIRLDCTESLEKLAALEQQEELCAEAVKESTLQKEKLAHELQTAMHEQRSKGVSGWLRRPSANKWDETANQQRVSVEELASRMDRVAMARMNREKGSDTFHEVLRQVDERTEKQLKVSIQQCTSVWDDALESVAHAARLFHSDAKASAAHLGQGTEITSEVSAFSIAGSGILTEDAEIVEPRSGLLDCVEVLLEEGDEELLEEEEEVVVASRGSSGGAGPPQHSPRECFSTAAAGGEAGEGGHEDGHLDRAMSEDPSYMVSFEKGVQRLGFEVLWEAEWPSIIKVNDDGEAQRVGVRRGDVLKEIGTVCTKGKGRDELMQLLKARPLRLKLDRGRRKDHAACDDGSGVI